MAFEYPIFNDYQVLKTDDENNIVMFYSKAYNSLYYVISWIYLTQWKTIEDKKFSENRTIVALECRDENDGIVYLIVETISLPLRWFDTIAKRKGWNEKKKEKLLPHLASIFANSMGLAKFYKEWNGLMPNYTKIDEVIDICENLIEDLKKPRMTDEQFCEKLTKVLHSTIAYDKRFELANQDEFEKMCEQYPETFNLFTPALKRYGVCESIASLFVFICMLADIKVETIYWINEPAVNHYNCFYNWKIYDPTFNSVMAVDKKYFEYKNFEIV